MCPHMRVCMCVCACVSSNKSIPGPRELMCMSSGYKYSYKHLVPLHTCDQCTRTCIYHRQAPWEQQASYKRQKNQHVLSIYQPDTQ